MGSLADSLGIFCICFHLDFLFISTTSLASRFVQNKRAAEVFCGEEDDPAAYDCSSSNASELLRCLQGYRRKYSVTWPVHSKKTLIIRCFCLWWMNVYLILIFVLINNHFEFLNLLTRSGACSVYFWIFLHVFASYEL